MDKRGYTPEQKAFIKQNLPGMTLNELTESFNSHFGLTDKKERLEKYCQHHKIPYAFEYHRLTAEQKEFIRQNSLGTPYKELTEKFNARFGLTRKQMHVMSYCRTLHCQNGIDSRFNPGHEPLFLVPIGSERFMNRYMHVKTTISTWRPKHIVIWESIHGPVPPKHIVAFGNGDRSDFDPDNLVLIPKRNMPTMNRHGLIGGNAELTRTGKIVSDVYLAISARKKSAAKRSRKERGGALCQTEY